MIPFILLIIPQDYAATVFAILEIFGLGNKVKALYGGEVNSLHNVITMAINLHSVFDSFNLWLEPVLGRVCALFTPLFSIQVTWCIQENTYDVCGKLLCRYPVPTLSRVTFSVEPSAAAAAKAAEQADQIWKILQSWQRMGVWLNFFLHACQRQHPDLLTFVGNISHAYRYALVIFCKCHRIASVTMTLVCYICLVSFQLVSLS